MADTYAGASRVARRVLVLTPTMRTTYDLLCISHRPRRRSSVRSSRRYSRFVNPLLEFFARHRTALAAHVQRQFPELFRTDRATRMHLQTLVAAGDLEVREGHGLGQANVYLCTQRGLTNAQRRADDPAADDRPARRRRPTGSHALHELLITEVAVSLTEAVRSRPDLALAWEGRFVLARDLAFRELVPDYAFLLGHAQGRLACLVEVFSGEESSTRIGQKVQAYAAWASHPDAQAFLTDLYRKYGAQEPRPLFRLLVIAHDRRAGTDDARLRDVLRETLALPRVMRHRIWATTAAALAASGGIDAPVWLRARDLDPHSQDLETATKLVRHRLFRSLVPQMPRHRLLPTPEDDSHAPVHEHQPGRVEHPPGPDRRVPAGRVAPA